MRQRTIELPSLESLPQTVCVECGKSKINGLFSPSEILGTHRVQTGGPRCRLCVGEVNQKMKFQGRRRAT
jgi:hypothetical protein